jgi:hypothetical protein
MVNILMLSTAVKIKGCMMVDIELVDAKLKVIMRMVKQLRDIGLYDFDPDSLDPIYDAADGVEDFMDAVYTMEESVMNAQDAIRTVKEG